MPRWVTLARKCVRSKLHIAGGNTSQTMMLYGDSIQCGSMGAEEYTAGLCEDVARNCDGARASSGRTTVTTRSTLSEVSLSNDVTGKVSFREMGRE